MAEHPEYTEFGIKIHKLRLTLKVQKRQSSAEPDPDRASTDPTASATVRRRTERGPGHRSRTNSTASSLADSLRGLELDASARSRRGFHQDFRSSSGTRLANWEFQGFYNGSNPPTSPGARTSTSSSGYGSTTVSRTSSFSSDRPVPKARGTRISSHDDSAYSEVYATIQELSELPDPFEEDPAGAGTWRSPQHSRTTSNATLTSSHTLSGSGQKSKSSSTHTLPFDIPPPLPPRMANCRPPARPPYPSSIVRAVQDITQPLIR